MEVLLPLLLLQHNVMYFIVIPTTKQFFHQSMASASHELRQQRRWQHIGEIALILFVQLVRF